MKKFLLAFLPLFIIAFSFVHAQKTESVPERLKFYKPIYEHTFNNSFVDVWNGIIDHFNKSNVMFQTKNKMQNDSGKFKGTIRTDFIIFTSSTANDTSRKVLESISKDPLLILGAVWNSARIQYLIKLKENADGTVYMTLKGTASGFEGNVTKMVNEYESNGKCETELMEKLIASVNAQKK